jgi:type III restriction enzyme
MGADVAETIDNPILNSPYNQPDRYYEIGANGPTGQIRDGRRPSESWVPIAVTKKGRKGKHADAQLEIDLDATGERRKPNDLVNDLRRELAKWRMSGQYPGVTPISRKLLQHWADAERENRVLFCQREAAETAIFLTEVAGRHGYADSRARVDPENAAYNGGLPRVALKMATGTGKTVVMAMLIAWQTLNKVRSPRDARFTNRFLIVTPGITIRDRLRVLLPEDAQNYYDLRDLIPADLKSDLEHARIVITNYHAFQLKDAKEVRGIARNTRLFLKGNRTDDPLKETPQAMVSRVLRDLGGAREKQQVMVLNDEAHHCYMDRPLSASEVKLSAEEKDANEEARVWFRGLQAVAKHAGIKQIYDLSATPYYLSGSGYTEGHLFPWTVSDFSLMDAIESGIVKVPRTPVDDDAEQDQVTYLRLWDFIGEMLPKKASKKHGEDWPLPPELEGALRSLHRSYERAFRRWEETLREYGEPPPVFIVVCNNTVVSKRVYDWIAGLEVKGQDGQVVAHKTGELELLSNVIDGAPMARPRTILIDSAQLESGEGMKGEFKAAVAAEIAAYKQEYRRRNPGADVEKITDEELLREVMNTVGKRGRLGEHVRCVVSVSMLTEGWDANTVTHILGVRAFRSQLLCEQVVGRGLRRRSYETNEEGLFDPEYANVYGIPFQFISSDKPIADPKPPRPTQEVESVEGREHLRITFPKLDGYRIELPAEPIHLDVAEAPRFEIGPGTVPRWVELGGVVGQYERDEGDPTKYRRQEVAFALAQRIMERHINRGDDREPWRFPQLVNVCRRWLDHCFDVHPGYSIGYLMTITEAQTEAAERIWHEIVRYLGTQDRRERLRPMISRSDPIGSTGQVSFLTRKRAVTTEKSEVSHVTLDGVDGNTWEQLMATELELNRNVWSYVKNDHLDLRIPYVHKGRSHFYVPDFLVRLVRLDDDVERTLIVEVSGSRKSPGPTDAKARTARDSWCVAVNNQGDFGRWGYVELREPNHFKTGLVDAIALLYGDGPIIGDPDLLDLTIDVRSARGA